MSIEYQLYSMSNPNHIIIPTIRDRPSQQDLNVFHPSWLNPTPQKHLPIFKAISENKNQSAFKKYKQKKDRTAKKQIHSENNLDEISIQTQKRHYNLKVRLFDILAINKQNQDTSLLEPSFGYYDPNEAALYSLSENEGLQLRVKSQIAHENAMLNSGEIKEFPEVKLKQPIQQEIEFKYVQLPSRKDDHFIIIRKEQIKKMKSKRADSHLSKQKPIKKQKHITKQYHKKQVPIIQQNQIKMQQDMIFPNFMAVDFEKEDESNSEILFQMINIDGVIKLNGNRQMFTLDQILINAKRKQLQELSEQKTKQVNLNQE